MCDTNRTLTEVIKMAGHSKWANIRHRKAAQDAKKGKIFQKLVRAIIVAAREGGGDPETNIKLRAAIERAKAFNLPSENIERAIKRGTGELEGTSYEEVIYEGYGPGGVAILVEAMTDNRNRTTTEIRTIFNRNGGSLGEAGCVSWIFERKGIIEISKENNIDEDTVMTIALEAGADDIKGSEEEGFTIYTDPKSLHQVKEAFEKNDIKIERAELTLEPKNTVTVDEENAQKLLKLLEILEDHDDVQKVYANFDIPDEIFNKIAA